MTLFCQAGLFEIIDCGTGGGSEDIGKHVLTGLTAPQKYLPSKFFYDERGSALFERICGLPEYYQTRTEISILRTFAASIMEDRREGSIVDLGSGASWKVRVLLDAVNGSVSALRYVPVDVCADAVRKAAEDLVARFPGLKVTGLIADLTGGFDAAVPPGKKLITFFGSTIGNLRREQEAAFLKKIRAGMKDGDRFLIGIDLIKRKEILESAYNDRQGVTAQFNLNILSVLNRELNARFDPDGFDHFAFYNEELSRIEMHLRAKSDMKFLIGCLPGEFRVRKGETILTEISRKYDRKAMEESAARAGLGISRWLTDPAEWFAVAEMIAARAGKTSKQPD